MKVRIAKCPNKTAWYSGMIGQTIDVYKDSEKDDFYTLTMDFDAAPQRIIDKDNCVVERDSYYYDGVCSSDNQS